MIVINAFNAGGLIGSGIIRPTFFIMIEYIVNEYFEFPFNTQIPSTGAVVDADETPTWTVYESNNDTPVESGFCSKRDDSNTVGYYYARSQVATGTGYKLGKDYYVRAQTTISSATGAANVGSFRVVPYNVARPGDAMNLQATAVDGIFAHNVQSYDSSAESAGAALKAAYAQGFGKWTLVGGTLTLYGPDGLTAVRIFTIDDADTPTSRTPS